MAAAVDAATGLPTPWKPTPTALVVKLAVSAYASAPQTRPTASLLAQFTLARALR